MEKIVAVDTTTQRRPHLRHRAIVNRVRRPYSMPKGEKVLDSSLALTLCGRALSNYISAENTSLLMTDGSVFAVQCTRCYEQD